MQRTLSTIAVLFVLGCNGQATTTRPVAAASAPSTPTATTRPESSSGTPSSPLTPAPPREVAGKYTIDNDASVRALGPGPANPKGQVFFGVLKGVVQVMRADLELRADSGYALDVSLGVEIEGAPRHVSESGVWSSAGPVLTLTRSGEVFMTCRVAASNLECREKADQPATIFRRVD